MHFFSFTKETQPNLVMKSDKITTSFTVTTTSFSQCYYTSVIWYLCHGFIALPKAVLCDKTKHAVWKRAFGYFYPQTCQLRLEPFSYSLAILLFTAVLWRLNVYVSKQKSFWRDCAIMLFAYCIIVPIFLRCTSNVLRIW